MQSFAQPLNILASVDSTNNYAMQKAHARMAKHGDAWLALEQKQGKGQRGKGWQSETGQNIALSIVTTPAFLSPENPFPLNVAFTLGTFDFVKSYAGHQTRIKWPNDIYWRDRKAGGILIESIIQGKGWKFAVTGIGLNINQQDFGPLLKRAISFHQITSKVYNVVSLAEELCVFAEKRYQQLQEGAIDALMMDYNNALYCLNQSVLLKSDEDIKTYFIKSVNNQGQLITSTPNGETKTFDWGAVEWILPEL